MTRQTGNTNNIEALLHRRRKAKEIRYCLYAILFILVLWSIKVTIVDDTDWDRMGGLGTVLKGIARFFPPDLKLIPYLLKPAIETFMIAFLGTALAIFLAIPVIWLSAHNITPNRYITYPIGRALMTLSRSVHEIVWALIFVSAVGLGAFPGILAVAMRSIGFISKVTAEAVEDVSPRPIEAIKAVGGNRVQVILFGILPQILPVFVGNSIFQWDINIRRATIMGLVGAGGLGLTLERQLLMYNHQGVTTVILAILLIITLGEIVSYYARKAIL
jgi:phosphonate transport system permease protein